uniref:50S ribosomal protein L11, chloroplastic n=1 Tax=Choreocolax polysiphoniae TaxID=282351 RepID=A0A0B5W2K4_9FLOR|nr:50S ribosomal protein L11 [Choreocolax polysiphoniae]AJH65884.1 50S ribosomal protein L11 [Choreocolax polysiphoniae]
MLKKNIGSIKLVLVAGKATPAPPVGPALGQYGININIFCKEYNNKTYNKIGLVIPVEILIYDDLSFSFILKTSPTSMLLAQAAKIKKGSNIPNLKQVGSISATQLYDIAIIKLSDLNTNNINKAISIVNGTANSMGISIK